MKFLLSIDVGIKNLACCLIAYSSKGPTESIDISLWELYDLTCSSSKVTPKKASPKLDTLGSGETLGFCTNVIARTKKVCGNKAIVERSTVPYCGVHDPKRAHKTKAKVNYVLNVRNLIEALEKLHVTISGIVRDSDMEIVIEQQSNNSREMLLYSHAIFTYFVSVGRNQVRFVPAYNKLLVYDGPEIQCSLKTPYARRKFIAKKHADYYLRTEPILGKHLESFTLSKKQDDLADSFLQGLYLIRGASQRSSSTDSETIGGNGGTGNRNKRRKRRKF